MLTPLGGRRLKVDALTSCGYHVTVYFDQTKRGLRLLLCVCVMASGSGSVQLFGQVGGHYSPPVDAGKATEEVRLYENARQREEIDNRANVYSLIQTIQALEKAYIKNAVSPHEYTKQCNILLDQYKAAFKLIEERFSTLESFKSTYLIHSPAAIERIKEGRPITIKDDRGNLSKSIFEIVSLFITVMDRLRLEIRAMDELHPDIKELNETMSRMSSLPSKFEGKIKVQKWLDVLNAMQASDELSEDQVRQMIFDFESAYNDFNRFVSDT